VSSDRGRGPKECRANLRRSGHRYLLHPFAIATNLARSTVVFSNLFLALSLESAISGERPSTLSPNLAPLTDRLLSGSLLSAVFFLSFATHLSLHPLLLLPPLILLANHMQTSQSSRRSLKTDALRGAIAFVAHQAILLSASRWFTGSWDFLSSVYGLMYVERVLSLCCFDERRADHKFRLTV
jgi:phosphatidylinositol glycan class U